MAGRGFDPLDGADVDEPGDQCARCHALWWTTPLPDRHHPARRRINPLPSEFARFVLEQDENRLLSATPGPELLESRKPMGAPSTCCSAPASWPRDRRHRTRAQVDRAQPSFRVVFISGYEMLQRTGPLTCGVGDRQVPDPVSTSPFLSQQRASALGRCALAFVSTAARWPSSSPSSRSRHRP